MSPGGPSPHPSNISPADGSLHTAPDAGMLSLLDFTFSDDSMADDTQTQTVAENAYPAVDVTFHDSPSLDEFLTIDGLLAYDDAIPIPQQRSLAEVHVAPYETLDTATQSWCGWMRRGMSLSSVTQSPTVQSLSQDAASRPKVERPVAHHNASLLIQSLRAFPEMMLQRETFPWFIHQQSQILTNNSTSAPLPQALSDCMSIAQMFTLRTSETTPFFWRTIKSQYRR